MNDIIEEIKQKATKLEAIEALKVLEKFICPEQLAAIADAMRGEEKQSDYATTCNAPCFVLASNSIPA